MGFRSAIYKYNSTIRGGAEALIDGIENIEMFLDDEDAWNFHDSEINSFYWDNEKKVMTVTVEPIGYGADIEGDAKDKRPLLSFHFEDCIDVEMHMNNVYEHIYEIEISRFKQFIECWFNGVGIRVTSRSLRVDKPRFVPIEEEN